VLHESIAELPFERRIYRERNVGMNCRTVTIERDDGSMKRIRRCD